MLPALLVVYAHVTCLCHARFQNMPGCIAWICTFNASQERKTKKGKRKNRRKKTKGKCHFFGVLRHLLDLSTRPSDSLSETQIHELVYPPDISLYLITTVTVTLTPKQITINSFRHRNNISEHGSVPLHFVSITVACG